jgi:hypothetical protein
MEGSGSVNNYGSPILEGQNLKNPKDPEHCFSTCLVKDDL